MDPPGTVSVAGRAETASMPLIAIIIVLLLLFGGGGFYGFNSGLYGGAGFGGISLLGIILIVLVIYLLSGRGRGTL